MHIKLMDVDNKLQIEFLELAQKIIQFYCRILHECYLYKSFR